MPNPPSTDGLPAWLQIVVSLTFLALSFGVVIKSWQTDKTEHKPTTIAHLADMQPVRDLADRVSILIAKMEAFCQAQHESEHWTRNNTEEMVRLRHAMENVARSLDRWQAH